MGRLTAKKIDELKSPGKFHDGDGLYLVVSPGGSKSWVYRYTFAGKRRNIGIGGYESVSPPAARDRAAECDRHLRSGVDPRVAKKTARAREIAEAAKSVTFEECALQCIEDYKPTWKNARQAPIWESSLRRFVFPHFGSVPVRDVSRPMVVAALRPIIKSTPETARRVRNRIERVLSFAVAMEYRPDGINPAKWEGGLDQIFRGAATGHRPSRQPAMPFAGVPNFYAGLARTSDVADAAIALLILTATRSGEIRGATWNEFDFATRVWSIPGERMKSGNDHRIPLSDAALEILNYRRTRARDAFVFPGRIPGRSISDMTMTMTLRRLGLTYVPHGFRSSFRDWVAECTDYQGDVAEMALAHAVANKVEAAYRRGDLFDKRRSLMSDWAAYCSGKITQCIPQKFPDNSG